MLDSERKTISDALGLIGTSGINGHGPANKATIRRGVSQIYGVLAHPGAGAQDVTRDSRRKALYEAQKLVCGVLGTNLDDDQRIALRKVSRIIGDVSMELLKG